MDCPRPASPTAGEAPQEQHSPRTGAFAAILELCWLLVAVLAPLWVNLWSSQPFDPAKAALVRSLVWVMAGLWLAHGLLSKRSLLSELRDHPLRWPVVALAVVLVTATLLGADPLLSLFGSYTRAQGLLTMLSYLLLFLVVSARLHTLEQAWRLLKAMVLTAGPLIALGSAQALGIDPLGLASDARAPIYATLGRSNFVGAYLALLLPLTLALLLHARSPLRRLGLSILLLGEGGLIMLTAARAPLLAAVAGLLVFAVLWRWSAWRAGQRLRVAVVALVGALAALLGLLFYVQQAVGGSVAARRVIWSASWDLVRRRPLLGYGPDSLELVFPTVYPPQLVYYQGRDLFVDRAHNLFLDWTLSAGLLGAAALGLLLGAFFLVALRRLSHAPSTHRALLAAAIAAVAAILAGNLVSFDVTATAVAGWLLMALAVSPALGSRRGLSPVASQPRAVPPPTWPRRLAASLLLATILVAVVQANVRPLLAGANHRQAGLHAVAGDWPAAIASARRAVALWPAEPEHRRLLGRVHLGHAMASGDAGSLSRAEAAFLAARDLRPTDVDAWSALGRFYHEAGVAFDPRALPQAHDAYQRAIALAPHDARLHVAWSQVYLAQNRPDRAARLLHRAVELDATDGLAYRLLGDLAFSRGDALAAGAYYEQARRWSAESAPAGPGPD